jgi:hypothetical protein
MPAVPPSLPIAVAPPPPPPPPVPVAPAFDVTTASVEFGRPENLGQIGGTNLMSTLAHAKGAIVQCYRRALPTLFGPVEGAGKLHVETDDSGTIQKARVTGAVGGSVPSCIASAVTGLRIKDVDTGEASADVPLEFKAR